MVILFTTGLTPEERTKGFWKSSDPLLYLVYVFVVLLFHGPHVVDCLTNTALQSCSHVSMKYGIKDYALFNIRTCHTWDSLPHKISQPLTLPLLAPLIQMLMNECWHTKARHTVCTAKRLTE